MKNKKRNISSNVARSFSRPNTHLKQGACFLNKKNGGKILLTYLIVSKTATVSQ